MIASILLPEYHGLFKIQTGLSDSNIAGVVIDEIAEIQIMVVSRPRGDTDVVGKAGLKITSTADTNINICFPKGAFSDNTEVRLQVSIR